MFHAKYKKSFLTMRAIWFSEHREKELEKGCHIAYYHYMPNKPSLPFKEVSLSQIIGHRFVFFTRYFLSLLDDLFYAARPRLFNCCLNFKGLIQPNAACLRCLL